MPDKFCRIQGYDTTATSSNWTLHFIGCYPEIQAKVHQELDSVFGNDEDREITMDDLKNLVYLECCIKESLRHYPPVSMFGRRIVEDVVVGEYFINIALLGGL